MNGKQLVHTITHLVKRLKGNIKDAINDNENNIHEFLYIHITILQILIHQKNYYN